MTSLHVRVRAGSVRGISVPLLNSDVNLKLLTKSSLKKKYLCLTEVMQIKYDNVDKIFSIVPDR